jgi:hypothetical protein
MSRNEARLFTSIWDEDDDFITLSPDAKLVYFFLTTQPDLGACGVIKVTPRSWARRLGVSLEALRDALHELDKTSYAPLDEDTDEALVRALIRRDGIWKMPKMLRGAVKEAALVQSSRLRAVIMTELQRLDPSVLPTVTRAEVTAILADLPKRLVGTVNNTSPDPPGQGRHRAPPDPPADPPGEPPPDPPAEGVRGKGSGNGSNHKGAPSPKSLTPSPRPSSSAVPTPLWPAPVPDPEGEKNFGPKRTPGAITALVAEIRGIRTDWARGSIERALSHPDVLDRPWPLVVTAALAVARDPESNLPGRLAADGHWWHQKPGRGSRPPRPPWCGSCDEQTRLVGDDIPRRCPDCHPLKEAS